MAKSISVSDETHNQLSILCKKNQTYSSLIDELIQARLTTFNQKL